MGVVGDFKELEVGEGGVFDLFGINAVHGDVGSQIEAGEHLVVSVSHGDAAFVECVVEDPEEGLFALNAFAFEEVREDVGAIELKISRRGSSGDLTKGGEKIEAGDRLSESLLRGDGAGPADDTGDAESGFGSPEFHAAKRSGGAEGILRAAVASEGFGAVVGGEDDEGVLVELELLEGGVELADGGIEVGDVGKVESLFFLTGALAIFFHEWLGGGDGLVWLVEGEVEKKGFFGSLFFDRLDPADCFVGGDAAGEAFDEAYFFTVANVVLRVGV